ncbi:MAG TPA: YggS family pyridoxal phosphate-dependent enzyme [candidate division Zixibacteria bacterium]|nr:YggS family pyridoxal phosphate-dependent enzyme [candidate division Zixibacteria bacterium]
MEPVPDPIHTPQLIRSRVDVLLARLREAAEAAGRDPSGFRLVAVTKGFGVPVVRAAREAGLALFGENRVREAVDKVAAVADAEWHMIGHLQSNKARAALQLFSAIHSVDSLPLLRRLERLAHDEGRQPTLLLQVNVSREPAKAGFDIDWFAAEAGHPGELVTSLRELRHARVAGLMTMAAFGIPPEEQRRTFATLRELRDRLEDTLGAPLPELSMGMTADAEAAVAEGATLVRVGTAIFGHRPR